MATKKPTRWKPKTFEMNGKTYYIIEKGEALVLYPVGHQTTRRVNLDIPSKIHEQLTMDAAVNNQTIKETITRLIISYYSAETSKKEGTENEKSIKSKPKEKRRGIQDIAEDFNERNGRSTRKTERNTEKSTSRSKGNKQKKTLS